MIEVGWRFYFIDRENEWLCNRAIVVGLLTAIIRINGVLLGG